MVWREAPVLRLELPPPSPIREVHVSRPKLTLACGLYDRTDALRTGDVKVDGLDIDFVAISNPREIFDRMGGKQEFDVSEFSSSEFISRLGRGDNTFVALPVFPSRVFRHGYIYINRKAGIRTPKDIAGKRIGVPVYTMTAAVWIRGHLMHQYGVDLSGCRWLEGAINHAGSHGDPSAPPLLKPIEVERDPQGRSLSELLANGEIDVIMGTQHPIPHPDIAPLFADARAVEREFAKTTRIFPMMHLVVIRRDVYERDPSIADRLYKGLVEAKNLALTRLKRGHPLMLPWLHHDLQELDDVFGGDPYPCGIEANRPSLEALVQYMVEQNFIPKRIPIEDIFVPVDPSLR
jgi:4,5-dihydroxyphthalate decarboxylase